jgi:transposase
LLRDGCPWRYLPRDGFPPRSTAYNIFSKFQGNGVSEAIWAELLVKWCDGLRETKPIDDRLTYDDRADGNHPNNQQFRP